MTLTRPNLKTSHIDHVTDRTELKLQVHSSIDGCPYSQVLGP